MISNPAVLAGGALVLAFVLLLSLGKFTARWKSMAARFGAVPHCPLTPTEMVFFCVLTGWTFVYFAMWLPALAVGAAMFLYLRHGISAAEYWSLAVRDIPACLKTGVFVYFSLLIPLLLVSWSSFKICSWFGYKEGMQPAVEAFLEMKDPRQIAGFLFMACVIAPVWEEVVFRGVFYPFLKNHLGAGWSMLLSSFVWASVHQYPPVFAPLLLLGFALVFVYETSGKLSYSIVLHAVFNTSTCMALILYKYVTPTAV
ncbi:MAG: CPBP family intramembrane metalloprotease [Methylacidiphilales bacterium]|nr:CPBP family intramembrane metalloprotease [Candidatus Methylacidiphilales bacterium]